MNLILYCHFVPILVLNFAAAASGRVNVYYSEGDTLDATILVTGIPKRVKDVVLRLGNHFVKSTNVYPDTMQTVKIKKILENKDGYRTYYIKLLKDNRICDMQPVIIIQEVDSTYASHIKSNCKEKLCKVNVTMDFNNKCQDAAIHGKTKIYYELEAKFQSIRVLSKQYVNYKIGDLLQVSCKGEKKSPITWFAIDSRNRPNVILETIPVCNRDACQLEMSLELFDDEKEIFCKASDDVTTSLVLKLNNTASHTQPNIADEVYYKENEELTFACQNQSTMQSITVSSPERRIMYNLSFLRIPPKEMLNNSLLFCTYYTNTDPPFKSTRHVYNYKLYLLKDNGEDSTNRILTIAPAIASAILLVVLVFLFLKYKRRTKQHSDEVDTDRQTSVANDANMSSRGQQPLPHSSQRNEDNTATESPDTNETLTYDYAYYQPTFKLFNNRREYAGDLHGDVMGDSVFDTVAARMELEKAERNRHDYENTREFEQEDTNEYCVMHPFRK